MKQVTHPFTPLLNSMDNIFVENIEDEVLERLESIMKDMIDDNME